MKRPSTVLLLNRGEQGRQEMEFPQAAAHGFMDNSSVLFRSGGEISAAGTTGSANPMKRAWEAMAGVPTATWQHKNGRTISIFAAHPPPPPTLVSLDQLQRQPPSVVSTGLRLSFDDQNKSLGRNPTNPTIFSSPSALSEEFAVGIYPKDEFDHFLRVQKEQLRRALTELWQRHCRALLSAAEESLSSRLREKDAELERATRRNAELEDRIERLRTESMAWQTKAAGYHAAAASLHAQLQKAAAAPPMQTRADGGGESLPAEDAESAYIDPERTDPEPASCRACQRRGATVVILPCRHLCLCDACDASPASTGAEGVVELTESCPICCCLRTGSVRVFLS